MMAVVKHVIEENDVVVLRERVGSWPAGTVGTAISIYDDGALVEISEHAPPGEALDMIDVPVQLLELRPRYKTPPADGEEAGWKPQAPRSRL
jgi:hypothetical protein